MLILEIAAGIVLGGLVLELLRKTRTAWYLLVGVPVTLIVGSLAAAIAWQFWKSSPAHSDAQEWTLLLGVPCLALMIGWSWPRTLSHVRTARANPEFDSSILAWDLFRWAIDQTCAELSSAAWVCAFLAALFGGPVLWKFAERPYAAWGAIASTLSWGVVALLALVSLSRAYAEKRAAQANASGAPPRARDEVREDE